MLAICLQKIGETEINWIIRLNPTIKNLILCHLYKTISMNMLSGNKTSRRGGFTPKINNFYKLDGYKALETVTEFMIR